MKITRLFFLFLISLSLPAEESGDSSTRSCRIIYLGSASNMPEKLFIFNGKNSQAVALSTVNFSKVLQIDKGVIELICSKQALEEPNALPENAMSVKIGEEINDFYLLVQEAAEKSDVAFQIEVIDATSFKLNAGETLWINQTNHQISATLGENTFIIPSKSKIVSSPRLKKSGYYKAEFSYKRDSIGNDLPIMRKSWWFDATSKNLGFIVTTDARLPKIFTIRDHR